MVKKRTELLRGSPPEYEQASPEFLTIRNAAVWSGMSTVWIRAQLTRQKLRRYKSGPGSHAKTLVRISDLAKLIQRG